MKNNRDYFINRCLRIYPALWFCFLISVLSVIIFGNVVWYFKETFGWVIAQLSIVQFYNPDFLRTYGIGVLNGSLWTIPVELQFYLLFPAIVWILKGKFTLDNHKGLLVFALFFIFSVWFSFFSEEESIITKFINVSAIPYFSLFLFGFLIQKNIEKLGRYLIGKGFIWLALYAVIIMLIEISRLKPDYFYVFLYPILGIVVISLAYTKPNTSEKLLRRNDISYGIYIYHMVFVNILVACGVTGTVASVFYVIALTFSFSFISWRFIEKPCLALKKKSIHKIIE